MDIYVDDVVVLRDGRGVVVTDVAEGNTSHLTGVDIDENLCVGIVSGTGRMVVFNKEDVVEVL